MIQTHNYGRQPFEVVVLAGSATTTVVMLLADKQPPSMVATMPPVWQQSWAIIFFLGNVIALAGVLMRDEVAGLFWESIGLFASAFMAWAYAVAILYRTGDFWVGYYAASIFFIYGAACAWRWFLIRRVIAKAKKV